MFLSAQHARGHAVAPGAERLGSGALTFSFQQGKTRLTQMRGSSPLTFLSPRCPGSAAWVICGSHGGGLVAGDVICMDVSVEPGASALITTQASTKVYRTDGTKICRQQLHASVDRDALLVLLPDPVCCFADSVFEQRQRIDMDKSSSLVLLDWLTSGRKARGERWAMQRYSSRVDVFVEGRQTLRDALCLDQKHGAIHSPGRMGAVDCFASVVLLGGVFRSAVKNILPWISQQPLSPGRELMFSGGPVPGGALLRIAGASSDQVMEFVKEKLAAVLEPMGIDPWSRRP